MLIRNGENSDINILKNIWKHRFKDEDCFIDWYFCERFNPFHSSVCEIDGKIVSCLYSVPVEIKIRDVVERGILIGGVSTLPEFEGRGYMKETFIYHLKRMRNAGCNFSILKAVDPGIYYSLEHRLINDVKNVYLKSTNDSCKGVREINVMSETKALYECFLSCSENYSGFLLRNYNDFKIKCKEYDLTGAKCLAVYDKDSLSGYCFYFSEDNKLYGEECVCINQKSYDDLFRYMAALPFEEIKLCVSKDVDSELIINSETFFGHSCYGMNISALLSGCGLDGYSIEITDKVIKENNGIFSLNGERVNKKPALKISNGFLMQWIFGYKSMEELIKEGNALLIDDESIVKYMDSRGKALNLCLDQY